MTCMRCQGLMVWDRFLDLVQTDLLWALAWRCVNCGEVLDAVIQSLESAQDFYESAFTSCKQRP